MFVGRYTRPSSGSALIIVHTPTLPVTRHESPPQVSLPNSSPCGMVWNVHFVRPECTSKPRIHPGGASRVMLYDEMDDGVMMVSPTTRGGDCTE